MKVAISVTAPKVNAAFESRFGRAAAFVIVDTETNDQEAFRNPAANAPGGAGVQAAEFLAGQGVDAVISGAFGPKAHNVLAAAGVRMYQAGGGKVAELVERLQQGALDPA
ncbi:MAG: NifB/NifX family molybdenum-iron cluster-binding protein [Anaerolineae bacterium]|nr:NifB/NifX family molybdenum-iron cluster-binding protein [Anaerolineae bacterium]